MSVPADFDTLVLGLAEFLLDRGRYPYPDLLRHACNHLSLNMTAPPYPRTWRGLLTLLEQPARVWCPYPVPDDFDTNAGLTYDGELSEEASRYLHSELLGRSEMAAFVPARLQKMDAENRMFQTLMQRLRDSDDPVRAQKAYVLLRSFLIEHSYTTGAEITHAFTGSLLKPSEVGSLYEACADGERCWQCDHCGPLRQTQGRLRGARPGVCDAHRPDLAHVREVPYQDDLRRVLPGIHWRVTLPGLPEIGLFHALQALRQEHPDLLLDVQLWPDIDRYDLRLQFADATAWAVDVKDYADPYRLARELKPLYGEGELAYAQAFYVFPARRLRENENYILILREQAAFLPPSHALLSVGEFTALVQSKIRQMRRAAGKQQAKASKKP